MPQLVRMPSGNQRHSAAVDASPICCCPSRIVCFVDGSPNCSIIRIFHIAFTRWPFWVSAAIGARTITEVQGGSAGLMRKCAALLLAFGGCEAQRSLFPKQIRSQHILRLRADENPPFATVMLRFV